MKNINEAKKWLKERMTVGCYGVISAEVAVENITVLLTHHDKLVAVCREFMKDHDVAMHSPYLTAWKEKIQSVLDGEPEKKAEPMSDREALKGLLNILMFGNGLSMEKRVQVKDLLDAMEGTK